MELQPYLDSVRAGVSNAASLADDHTRHIADQLGTAVEASARLALVHALTDAAAVISADLAPSSVELRMAGQDPEFVVTVSAPDDEPTFLVPDPVDPDQRDEPNDPEVEDEPASRITLRVPQSVKSKVDDLAATAGISTNAWLLRAVMDALEGRGGGRGGGRGWPQPPKPPGAGALFGPNGPFGPHGVFGPHGPFGGGDDRGGWRPPTDPGARERPQDRRTRGNVQGWVR